MHLLKSSSALLVLIRVILRNNSDTIISGNGTESGSIMCTSDRVAVSQYQCLCDAPAISAIENAMGQYDYYYKLWVRR